MYFIKSKLETPLPFHFRVGEVIQDAWDGGAVAGQRLRPPRHPLIPGENPLLPGEGNLSSKLQTFALPSKQEVNIHFQYWVTRATPKEEEEGNNNNNNNNSIGNSKGRRRKSEKEERRLERRRESQVEEKYGANGVDIGLQVHLDPT